MNRKGEEMKVEQLLKNSEGKYKTYWYATENQEKSKEVSYEQAMEDFNKSGAKVIKYWCEPETCLCIVYRW